MSGDIIKCLGNGMITPFISIVIYQILKAMGLLEQILRKTGVNPIISVATVAAILTLINIVFDICSALRDRVCALISVLGIVFIMIIFYATGVYDLISITLPDVILTIIATSLGIMLISIMKSRSRQEECYFC